MMSVILPTKTAGWRACPPIFRYFSGERRAAELREIVYGMLR
jgi:hypothetical protein